MQIWMLRLHILDVASSKVPNPKFDSLGNSFYLLCHDIQEANKHLRIGLFGGGVVGGGTYEPIKKCAKNGRFSSVGMPFLTFFPFCTLHHVSSFV